MYSLSIVLGSMSWRLLYTKEENARRDFQLVQSAISRDKTMQFSAHDKIDLTDDYGQEMTANARSLHGAMLEDLDKTKVGNVEFALHGARANVDAQKRAESDPVLRSSRTMQHAPIISPMGNGRLS